MLKSLSIGGLSMSDDLDAAIRQYQASGDALVDVYIGKAIAASTSTLDEERVDSTMDDFRLDLSEVPTFRE
jgi:hypothetical protein